MTAGAVAAIVAATARDDAARVPFDVDGRTVGSVDRRHLRLLALHPALLAVDGDRVALRPPPSPGRDDALAGLHRALRAAGAIAAWRDERFALPDPATGEPLALIERAAARFWGTLTVGAHLNGHVADDRGRPQRLWVARRSAAKATDPGLSDNLVGGGVGAGQTPWQALVREAAEEAGLDAARITAARPGAVLRLDRDIPEGRQVELLHAFDLALDADWAPRNADGEVERFDCLPVADAVALACGRGDGPPMTVDAALVTIDFALRHRLLDDPAIASAIDRLRVAAPGARRDRLSPSARG